MAAAVVVVVTIMAMQTLPGPGTPDTPPGGAVNASDVVVLDVRYLWQWVSRGAVVVVGGDVQDPVGRVVHSVVPGSRRCNIWDMCMM